MKNIKIEYNEESKMFCSECDGATDGGVMVDVFPEPFALCKDCAARFLVELGKFVL